MIDQVNKNSTRSIRKSCRVLGFRRQTYYSRKNGNRPEQKDELLTELLRLASQRFIAWGFWMIFYFLRNEYSLEDNHKRVYRLWKQADLHLRVALKRPAIQRKYQDLTAPDLINQGWAMDFVSDWIIGPEKQSVRIINIMDEGSRRALWTQAHESISATKLISVLDKVIEWRGAPQYIRCDNGPEFIAKQLNQWADKNGIELRYIQPGKPSQNGLIERLNKTLRKECLNLHWFSSMDELNENIQEWSVIYNGVRPHKNLAHMSPIKFEELNSIFYFKAVAA